MDEKSWQSKCTNPVDNLQQTCYYQLQQVKYKCRSWYDCKGYMVYYNFRVSGCVPHSVATCHHYLEHLTCESWYGIVTVVYISWYCSGLSSFLLVLLRSFFSGEQLIFNPFLLRMSCICWTHFNFSRRTLVVLIAGQLTKDLSWFVSMESLACTTSSGRQHRQIFSSWGMWLNYSETL